MKGPPEFREDRVDLPENKRKMISKMSARKETEIPPISFADRITPALAAEKVGANLIWLREARERGEATARALLTNYVANREKAFEAFERVDPTAQFTQAAKQRLEKARRDLQDFEARLA